MIVNHEDESRWSKKSAGDKGWMVRCDEILDLKAALAPLDLEFGVDYVAVFDSTMARCSSKDNSSIQVNVPSPMSRPRSGTAAPDGFRQVFPEGLGQKG